jgi:hypothetical protein
VGREGPCFPSHESLAHELVRSVRQVIRWLENLVAFGLIIAGAEGVPAPGRGRSNEYTFLWSIVFEVSKTASKYQNRRF